MEFRNMYEDAVLAEAYSKLEFPGTYYLAFRDLPEIFVRHARGEAPAADGAPKDDATGRGLRALDLGCGSGRSTRFLRKHGFDASGADISEEMVERARSLDPGGDYRLVGDGDLRVFADGAFDLALSMFTFDNVPTREKKLAIFHELRRVLRPGGVFVNVVSSPAIYVNEWASFSTKDYPQNGDARTGDRVLIVNTAIEDRRPVEDVVWFEEAYREIYAKTGFEVIEKREPLGREDEGIAWVSETRIAPWVVYVLGKAH